MFMSTDSSTVVTKCSRPSCSKVSRMEEEVGGNPVLAVLSPTSPNEVRAPRGFCFGDRWFCSVECLEWGMGQEILQLFRKSREKGIRTQKRMGSILLLKGLIRPVQLKEALEAQRLYGKKLGYWLFNLGHVSEEKLIVVLAEHMRIPWINEVEQPLNSAAASVLPKMLCQKFNVFPLEFTKQGGLVLAVDFNWTEEFSEAVKEVVGCQVKPFLTRSSVLQDLIGEHVETQTDNTFDVIPERVNFASQAGHMFVRAWFGSEAERARFGLLDDTLWVRYLKGEDVKDHFILFGNDVGIVSPENASDRPEGEDSEAQAGAGR